MIKMVIITEFLTIHLFFKVGCKEGTNNKTRRGH